MREAERGRNEAATGDRSRTAETANDRDRREAGGERLLLEALLGRCDPLCTGK